MSLLGRIRSWLHGADGSDDDNAGPSERPADGDGKRRLDPSNVTEVRSSETGGVDPVEKLRNVDADDEDDSS